MIQVISINLQKVEVVKLNRKMIYNGNVFELNEFINYFGYNICNAYTLKDKPIPTITFQVNRKHSDEWVTYEISIGDEIQLDSEIGFNITRNING